MKKIISLITTLVLLASVMVMPANAALPPIGLHGDVDGNYAVDVIDATVLQNVLAGNISESEFGYFFAIADADYNGIVDVMDATEIQRWVAQLSDNAYLGEAMDFSVYTNDFYSDYESGMAMAGVPVTFTCSVVEGSPIVGYELWVDEVLVAKDRENPSLKYTFPEPGEYDIELKAITLLETGVFQHENFEVVAQYDITEPVITSMYVTGTRQWGDICFDTDGYYYHANVIGGMHPYTYTFTVEIPGAFSGSDVTCYGYENIEENYIELPEVRYDSLVKDGEYNSYLKCKITVEVTDAAGVVTSKSEDFYYNEMRIG